MPPCVLACATRTLLTSVPQAANSSKPSTGMRRAASHTRQAPTTPRAPAAAIKPTGSVELTGNRIAARQTNALNMNSSASDQAIAGRRATTRRSEERSGADPLRDSGKWVSAACESV